MSSSARTAATVQNCITSGRTAEEAMSPRTPVATGTSPFHPKERNTSHRSDLKNDKKEEDEDEEGKHSSALPPTSLPALLPIGSSDGGEGGARPPLAVVVSTTANAVAPQTPPSHSRQSFVRSGSHQRTTSGGADPVDPPRPLLLPLDAISGSPQPAPHLVNRTASSHAVPPSRMMTIPPDPTSPNDSEIHMLTLSGGGAGGGGGEVDDEVAASPTHSVMQRYRRRQEAMAGDPDGSTLSQSASLCSTPRLAHQNSTRRVVTASSTNNNNNGGASPAFSFSSARGVRAPKPPPPTRVTTVRRSLPSWGSQPSAVGGVDDDPTTSAMLQELDENDGSVCSPMLMDRRRSRGGGGGGFDEDKMHCSDRALQLPEGSPSLPQPEQVTLDSCGDSSLAGVPSFGSAALPNSAMNTDRALALKLDELSGGGGSTAGGREGGGGGGFATPRNHNHSHPMTMMSDDANGTDSGTGDSHSQQHRQSSSSHSSVATLRSNATHPQPLLYKAAGAGGGGNGVTNGGNVRYGQNSPSSTIGEEFASPTSVSVPGDGCGSPFTVNARFLRKLSLLQSHHDGILWVNSHAAIAGLSSPHELDSTKMAMAGAAAPHHHLSGRDIPRVGAVFVSDPLEGSAKQSEGGGHPLGGDEEDERSCATAASSNFASPVLQPARVTSGVAFVRAPTDRPLPLALSTEVSPLI